jgi:Winged helix DNA-binding domain
MTSREFLRHRLINQRIIRGARKSPSEVVAWLGAMQAQDYSGALWAIGLRSVGAVEADVERAIAERTILRTWPMRGTLHFVAAADVRWMLALLTPRIVAGSAARARQLELDDAIFTRSRKIFIRALQGGRALQRDAMCALLECAKIPTAGQRGYHILWRLAQEGILCFGTRAGGQHTFALLDEWAPDAKTMDREQALGELARRYFTGHGPATLQDFVWWSGLKISDGKAGLAMAAAHLSRETMDGVDYWMPQSLLSPGDDAAPVHLLPGFDQYMLGYADRSAALDPLHSQKIVPGNNGMFMPTIVARGRVAGTWKRVFKRRGIVIEARPFAPLNKTEMRAFAAAARRYGDFMGMPVEVP